MILLKAMLTKELLSTLVEIGEILVDKTDNDFDDKALHVIKAVVDTVNLMEGSDKGE